MRIIDSEHSIAEPPLKIGIVAELFEQLGVIFHEADDYACERLVVLDPSVLLVGVLLRVLIGFVRRNLLWNLVRNQLANPVGILPGDVAELVIERLEDVRKPIEFGLWSLPSATGRHRV